MTKQIRIYLFLFLATLLAGLPAYGQVGSGIITLTTAKSVGEKIDLYIRAYGGFIVEGAERTSSDDYKLKDQLIVIRGNVTELICDQTITDDSDINSYNRLTTLNASGCPTLERLDCSYNELTNLNVSGCTALTRLYCSVNRLTALDVSGCTALTELRCSINQLTSLNVSGCTALAKLNCYVNQLTKLDVSSCTALTTLDCYGNPLTSLDVSGCTALTELECYDNKLPDLDISSCSALEKLECYGNQLTTLDVSQNTALKELYCYSNQLTGLDLTNNTALEKLYCYSNQIKAPEMALLVKSLVNRQGQTPGRFVVHYRSDSEGNLCYSHDVDLAREKSWFTFTTYGYTFSESIYNGEPSPNFAVTQTIEGEGTLNIIGATDLTAVPYATELTIEATPAEGYELTVLTANGTDILASKKCVVADATEVKATFTKKKFAVTITEEGEGTLAASGADDLAAVPYGTELTFTAAPSEGYELTALTANGTDIFATQKVEVKEAVEVVATFSKKKFATITLTHEGEGTLNATGAADLTRVSYDIELTIEATPAEGYELTALVANGVDILSTKKFVVKKDTEVKAVFAKKTFVVTLTKDGEGTLTATGAAELTLVPYGTELTVEATPAEGYVLKALTANGTNIQRTKKVVVKEATEVKATFAKKTFGVTLSCNEYGNISIVESVDPNAVPYGTELTIKAQGIGEMYELTALTANGTDILATKKLVVTGATEVKATFAKKTFAVTLTKVGEGTLNATGADNLNAVEYGAELTIEATPAEGYYLMALTANGTDILATKKVVVKEATEVKATFAKKTFGVTLISNELGSISIVESVDLKAIPYGTELTVKAQARDAKYELKALTANGVDILATKKFIVTRPTEVKATFAKPGFAVTLVKEGEGKLNATGTDDLTAVPEGTELTIEATPAEGYYLMALTANGTNILTTKKVVVKGATEVKATFAKKTFSVTLISNKLGNISIVESVDPDAVPYGTELTIKAQGKDAKCELTALTANGVDILATKKFVVTGSTVVKATFTKPGFAVTLTKEGEGTLNATGADNLNAVEIDTELTIEATPAEGYYLMALTANGTDILATRKVVVKEAMEVKATFVKKTFTVTLTKEAGEGKLAATGAADLTAVPYGTELTIEATPEAGYELKALTANGADILATKKFVVKGATEIKATFVMKPFTVTLTKEGEGTLNATGADNLNAVAYGTELTIEATPAEGYYLMALTANGTDILATRKVVVKESTEVKAIFVKKTFTVTLTKEGEGTLNATGADDINAVPFGTELTIEATPAEGYTLVALTANGTDILATKKVVVKEATEVKAIFVKKTFAVKLTKEGEGTLNATGVDNLNAVAYGTELTIEATPTAGYELKELTANGTDILATKKVVVKEATELKAIFAKKTFGVTLTHEGEGTLNAIGADNLNAVAYGTELTIDATPAEGYTLVALTANGTDILATKKFTVTAATEIKATFTKKTAADRVEAGTVRLYPNPASAYVNVKAAKADALVRLYDANGTLLYEARTDDHGMLQFELSAYAEGTYLLLVDGNAQRLLIQR